MVQVVPSEMLTRVRRAWDASDEALPPLPPDDVITQIITVAFWASMRTEEKRTLSFRISCCSPEMLAREEDARPPLMFTRTKPLSSQELVRISPALDFRQSLVGVCTRRELDPADGDDEVVIWGIVDSGLSWWEHTKGEPWRRVHNHPPPDCFTVSSHQPGTMSISCKGHILISLRDGNLAASIPNLLHGGPVGRYFGEHNQRLLDEVTEEVGSDFSSADAATRAEVGVVYLKFHERLLACMREFNHGGAILFVPDQWRVGDPQMRERLLVKFPTESSRTWDLLGRYLGDLHVSVNAMQRAVESEVVERRFFLDFLVTRHRRDSSEDMIRDRSSLLASLTRVDGSIVLTRSLDLLGFGTEIIWPAPALETIHVAQDVEAANTTEISIDSFGTRHRSAFRFCDSHGQVLAIILSSDGDIRVVKKVGEQVVMWNGLDSPELGL